MDATVMKRLVEQFDIEGAGFTAWLVSNQLELTLTKQDDKLIRRYLTELFKGRYCRKCKLYYMLSHRHFI